MKRFYTLILLLALVLFPSSGQRQMEALDRGLVAVRTSSGVFLSWRILGTDSKNVQFNIYRDGSLLTPAPLTYLSNYVDVGGNTTYSYTVETLLDGIVLEKSNSVKPLPVGAPYLSLALNRPPSGTTPPNKTGSVGKPADGSYPQGQYYSYSPNDCSVGDVDGDGEYELIVKWNPSNAQDNSYYGITGNVYIDAYKLSGKQLWRIDLGKNIRAGAHYTQFLVYDFDGDGKAELICKTAPGTVDGKGNYVVMNNDNPTVDYRNRDTTQTSGSSMLGTIRTSSEYLTLFDGETGAELHTIAYNPPRGAAIWGDSYFNRSDRFLACVAYLDGVHPSAVMCRGYYTRATLASYDVANKKLVQRWFYDSGTTKSSSNIYGQGNHNLSVGDVDDDGKDEIIYGSSAIDHDGKMLYNTQLGHGDAMHLSDLDPDRPGLEVFAVKEESSSFSKGFEMHDAKTGAIVWSGTVSADNGRGLAADIDPNHRGFEMWSTNKDGDGNSIGVYNCKGEMISSSRPSVNFRIYWDGDLQDELLDGTAITKWIPSTSKTTTLLSPSGVSSCNGTKKTPNLSADLFGDWREELVVWETGDSSKLRIYTTTIPTSYGLYTLMHDPVYRLGIAWQNVAYNQPPHLGFYIGDGVGDAPIPNIHTIGYTPSGIKGVVGDSFSCRARMIEKTLYLDSESRIKSFGIYNLAGLLLKQQSVDATSYSEQLSMLDSSLYMLKVNTVSGTKFFKIRK